MSVEGLLLHPAVALKLSSMEREISRVKRACLLSQNQIQEIVMDSDNKENYYVSEDTEDDEPHPPLQRSSISEPPSPDFLPSALKMRMMLVMWQVNSHNPACGHQPRSHAVHTFNGALNGKSREAAHVTSESTPLSVLLLLFAEIITLLVVEMNRYYHQFLENSDVGASPEREVTSGKVCVFGSDITDGTYTSRQTGGLLDEKGTALHSILWTNVGTC